MKDKSKMLLPLMMAMSQPSIKEQTQSDLDNLISMDNEYVKQLREILNTEYEPYISVPRKSQLTKKQQKSRNKTKAAKQARKKNRKK
jgi:guanylate kinase